MLCYYTSITIEQYAHSLLGTPDSLVLIVNLNAFRVSRCKTQIYLFYDRFDVALKLYIY